MYSFFLLIDDKLSCSILEELYFLYHKNMVFISNRILHDRMLAEDATHDAFLRLSDHLNKISDPNSHEARAFLELIVRNVALDYYRKRQRMAEVLTDNNEFIADSRPTPDECLESVECDKACRDLILSLQSTHAEILTLRYYFEYNDKEIAQLLNISHTAVRTRLKRARAQLKLHIEKYENKEPQK
ncbi:MAG: sigma-70 family RNA polymerase sigma factor [Ruminococcaceae bacterium]|nr:sigma-70 family RNA polymerase sigma factor [Oscillospiraceae bacterium]